MFDPSMPKSDQSENRYMLASIIGKRAVQLEKGSERMTECESDNNVTAAISEYKQDKLTYTSSGDEERPKKRIREML